MKVLHILHEINPSGAEVMLSNSKALWDAQGIQPELLATSEKEGVYADVLRQIGYPVHHLHNDKRMGFFVRYMRFLREHRFDLIHMHVEGSGYWLSLASMWMGCKVIRVVHSNFIFDGYLRWRRAWQRRHLSRLGVPFVAIAEGVLRNERERFGIEPTLVWNWADVDKFRPPTPAQREHARAQWGFAPDDVVVVTVGNCAEVKNHPALIQAMALCRDIPSLRYLHVGREDASRSEAQQAAELNLQDRVIFAGWSPDVLPALYAADVFAMPSLYEGFSIAATEALATGLPGLLTDVPGLRDFGRLFPGLLYCDTNAESIAQSLRAFCAMDATSRRALAIEYPAIARTACSPHRGVSEYASLYRQTLRSA